MYVLRSLTLDGARWPVHHIKTDMFDWSESHSMPASCFLNAYLNRKRELEGLIGEGAETVEPILDSFGGYSTDNLSNFYYPYIIVLLMIFRDEVSHYCRSCQFP